MSLDTEEMYRRGAEDAERGEAHPFYYQHYYHYRRGYDEARSRSLRPLQIRVALVLGGVVLAGALGAFFVSRNPLQSSQNAPKTVAALVIPTSTPRPLFPTPTAIPATPEPTTSTELRVDSNAIVTNMAGRALRGRVEPNLKARVQTTFREGERVHVIEGPVEADGLRWWRIENDSGNGWSAERSPEGIVWLTPNS